jgi:hypothetical protein
MRNGKKRSVVGDPINFRGMVYAPIHEAGVVYLFGMIAVELGFLIEQVKTEFPDCTARRRSAGRGFEEVAIEFEYNSRSFLAHQHDPALCDLIVCWEHDWRDSPIEVLELRKLVKTLPNPPFRAPDPQANQTQQASANA